MTEDATAYNEVLVAGYRDEGNTQKTLEYGMTMDLNVANID